jgi:hypothetical protein
MRAFMGCDRADLEPGSVVTSGNGIRYYVIRRATLEEARESWDRCGDGSPLVPVGDEYFYEIDTQLAPVTIN